MSFPSITSAAPRSTLARLIALAVLLCTFALFAGAASARAATLNVVFDDTSPGASTGSAPFDATAGPGNDTSATDHVVRSHDTITYHWGLSANGGSSPNTTIRQTLPAGMTWSNLPAYCITGSGADPVSSLSADKRTIVCNTGTQGSSAVDLYPTATVSGLPNGTALTTEIEVSSSDPGTASVTSPPVTDTVSAAPRVNLEKQSFFSQNVNRNGVDGVSISYSLSLLADTAGTKGMKGAETITQPVTFTDDISGFLPGAEFVGITPVSGGTGTPFSKIGNGTTATNSVPNSGTWSGAQPGGAGGNIDITVTGADLSGDSIPTKSAGANTLPASKQFLATMVIELFVPFTSIPGNTPVPFANVVSGFAPRSVTGQQNYGPGGREPLADNTVSGQYLKPVGQGGIGKAYASNTTSNRLLPSASGGNSGDGLLLPGTTFYANHRWDALGGAPQTYTDAILCDNLDNSTYSISTEDLPAGITSPAWIAGTPSADWVIEYSNGGVRGATPAKWYAANGPRDQTCADSDSGTGTAAGWVTDPSTLPGGLASVTSVRARLVVDATGIQLNAPQLNVNYKVRQTDYYTNDPIVPGRKAANFIQMGSATGNAALSWRTNTYDPLVNNNVLGAVATTAGGVVRISKDTDPSGQVSALSGSIVKYSLQPSVTAPITSGASASPFVMHDVVVVDTIPDQMTYVAGSASVAPASVVVNPDGTTTVTWNLGDQPVNTVLPAITYQTRVKLTAPNGAQEVNKTVISSPDDPSAAVARTDDYTVRVDKVFGIAVVKTTATPWNEPLDGLEFNIEYINNAADAVTTLDMIDVLPYNGDERGATDSKFHGTARVKSVTPANPADVVLYTSRTPDQVSKDPKSATNDLVTGATKWCTAAQLGATGCPATLGDATAVRVRRTGTIPSGEGGSVEILLSTAGNESGDVYVNDAGLAAGGVSLPAFADPVIGRVVASNVGDFVWEDTNKNGIQDAGEPGLEGVKVTLTGTDKDGGAVERSVTTDKDGKYTFASADGGFTLRSGEYRLTFAKDGYAFTTEGAGDDRAEDSDADPANGRTGTITLKSPIPGRADLSDLDWDAGMIQAPKPPEDPPTPPTVTTNTTPTPPTPPTTPPATPKPPRGTTAAKKHHVLAIAKLANRRTVRPGQRITYTLKVTASKKGNEDAVNEQLCDTLPANLTLVTKAGGTVRNGRLCWTIKRLAPGKTVTKRFVVRVDRDAEAGNMVNTATVTDQGRKRTAKRTVRVLPASAVKADSDYVTG